MRRLVISLALLIAIGLGGWIGLTTLPSGRMIATWAPCPRNWIWIPTWLPRPSPLESTAFALGAGHVKVCYGSPSLRGRTMIGGAAVPFGHLWRTGANEPTTLHTDVALTPRHAAPRAGQLLALHHSQVRPSGR